MSEHTTHGPTRRGFLESALALVSVPLVAQSLSASPSSAAAAAELAPRVHTGYRSLTPDEAAFTESMVNALCPADHMTPSGTACGLAMFIDTQLDGEFGGQCAQGAWEHGQAGVYSELPLTEEQFFKAGIARIEAIAQQRSGMGFAQLAPPAAAELLREVAAGRVTDSTLPLVAWYGKLVEPLLVRASFSGPIYDGHDNRVFWKLFVQPVAPV